MGLNPMTCVLIRRGENTERRHTDTQGEGHRKIEADVRMMLPQAQGCHASPEAGKGKEGLLPTPSRGHVTLIVPSLWLTKIDLLLLASRTVRQQMSVISSH